MSSVQALSKDGRVLETPLGLDGRPSSSPPRTTGLDRSLLTAVNERARMAGELNREGLTSFELWGPDGILYYEATIIINTRAGQFLLREEDHEGLWTKPQHLRWFHSPAEAINELSAEVSRRTSRGR